MKIYNIGIIGCGSIAAKMAATLGGMKGVKRYAVASRTVEKAKAFAEKWQFAKAYGSYEELASDAEVDLIYIATPHAMHYDNARLCIEKGKPVLCEGLFVTLQYEKIRGCHSTPAYCQPVHVFASGRYGSEHTAWLPGHCAFRT